MPRAAPKPCRQPGCPVLVHAAGYCEQHRAATTKAYNKARADYGPATDALYKMAAWRRLRREVLDAEPLCRHCVPTGRMEPATLVDHIQPVKQGGAFWDRGNLQPLCNPCHEIKSHAEGSRGAHR